MTLSFTDGVRLLIHESATFASSLSFEKFIPHRKETQVRLKTIVRTCSPQVSELSQEARQCLFETEKSLL